VKTTKLALLLLTVLGASLPGARAQTPAPAPAETTTGSWILTPSVVSQYMFRGVRLGGPAFQPSLEYDYGALAAGVWTNFPMKDRVVGQSDPEVDPYASYTFTLVADRLTLVPGFTWYTYPDAKKENGYYKDTFEPSLALNYTIGLLKLTPKLYYDVVLHGPTYELTATVAVPLKEIGSELDFIGTVGTFKWTDALENSSPATKNWGDYWLLGVGLPFQVTKASKLTVGVAYTKGSNNYVKFGSEPRVANSAAVGRTVVSVSYAWTF
jgi:uncharacterized protein (TIGR02001 family)